MKNLRKYGKAPFSIAVIHGGPGAGVLNGFLYKRFPQLLRTQILQRKPQSQLILIANFVVL